MALGIKKPRRKLDRSARADFIERTNLGLPMYGARFSASLCPYKGANTDKVEVADFDSRLSWLPRAHNVLRDEP